MTWLIWSRLPEASLTPTMFGSLGQAGHGLGLDVDGGAALDVVDDHRQIGHRLGDARKCR